VQTEECFTCRHRNSNEHDFFTFQAALGDVAVEKSGMSSEHRGNLDTELVYTATKVVVSEIQKSDRSVTVQGINDITSALVGYLALCHVHFFQVLLLVKPKPYLSTGIQTHSVSCHVKFD